MSVHIVLEWICKPYEIEVMARGDNNSKAFLGINPSGQVPALQISDGHVLTEAAAILAYLSDICPEADLGNGSPDPIARYEIAQMLSFLTGEVHVAFKPYFSPQRFLTDETQFDALRQQAFVVLEPMLATLEKKIGKSAYLLNGRISVVDPYLYVLLRWVENAPYGIASFPSLARFRLEMEADSGVQRALALQGMSPIGAA